MTEERRQAAQFASRLESIFGASLVSVLLYGSAARGDYRAGSSDLNLLVILEELGLDQLRRVAPLTKEWIAGGNPPPMMLSRSEWWGSADVFPLEYTDIREAHVVLAGTAPFENLSLTRKNLRHQLEHELRSRKIQLREGYIAAGDNPENMGKLLIASVSSFMTLFRAMLRLSGSSVPADRTEQVRQIASKAGFTPDALLEVLRAKSAGGSFTVPLDGQIAADYLQSVEKAVSWLDSVDTGAAGASV